MDYYTLAAFVSFVFIPTIGIYLWWLRKYDDYWKRKGIPYVPRTNVISGIIAFLYSKPAHEQVSDAYKEYGRIHGSFEFRKPSLTIGDPDVLKNILVKDFHAFSYRRDCHSGDGVISKMVTVLKGEDWKRVRTIITPAFTSKRMRQMSRIINECSSTVIETFEKYAARKEPVDCKSIFGAFTLDVIGRTAFATKIDSHNDPNNIFVKQAKETFMKMSFVHVLVSTFVPKWIKAKLRLGRLKSLDFFKNVILGVITERKKGGKRYDDILQMLLDAQEEIEVEGKISGKIEDETDQFGSVVSNGAGLVQKYKKMSEDELIAQCILFFIVGYETTTSVLSFMAYSLALNPECQEKLIEEIDEVFQKHESIDYDEIRDMKYLDCIVSEVLRMFPSLIRIDRTAVEDYKLDHHNLVIEKGTIIGIPAYAMHYDPEFFPNPGKFDPERFLHKNDSHPQYAYLPFGAGPRNCLGMRFALMEIKLCMCKILRHYRFKKSERTKIPLEFKRGEMLLSVNELLLHVEKRNL